MLAIGRTLMGNPALLLLDEPSEGLAPLVVRILSEQILLLKQEGMTILLAEQNFHFAARVSDRAYIIEKGRIQYEGRMDALAADAVVRRAYLMV
jgi:branched-chain amino acid transport system ATP-binding protein